MRLHLSWVDSGVHVVFRRLQGRVCVLCCVLYEGACFGLLILCEVAFCEISHVGVSEKELSILPWWYE